MLPQAGSAPNAGDCVSPINYGLRSQHEGDVILNEVKNLTASQRENGFAHYDNTAQFGHCIHRRMYY
jgi:hypothetical protein